MYAAAIADCADLYAEHTAAWAKRSNEGRLEIAGDLELAQAVNTSLYFLRSSVRADWPYGLSPGGLASNGYDGNTFWDQETWMWPNLLLLDEAVCAMPRWRFDVERNACWDGDLRGAYQMTWPPLKRHDAPLTLVLHSSSLRALPPVYSTASTDWIRLS